ncbi:MAG TPA: XrtA system polysaccharide chain length determinant [Stellaceae bacterium]|nr:XrtA system polysaccharide chain length determinant [Stellaceae bacterium]
MERWYPMIAQPLATAWRWRWALVAVTWGVCLVGWVAVAVIPNSYESDARLYVDADAVLTPLLRGLAVDTAASGQIEVMQKTLLSRPNLERLIGMTDLELQATNPEERERLVRRLAGAIKVQSQDRNIFTISYRNASPRLAHDVVAALLSIFMEEASRTNRSDMKNAQQFLSQQIASYETQLRTAEQRRADFRRKYLDILPLENNGGFSRLDNARADVQNLGAQLHDATAKLTAVQQQVRITPPLLGSDAAGAAQNGQLVAAERHLADLQSMYTDQNPDVIIARRLVASLRASATRHPAAAVGGRAIPNPLYAQLHLQLIDSEAAVASLRGRLDTARKDRQRLEALARAAPGVEAQYQNLDRDYNVIRKNYEELLARRESSNITKAADTSADQVKLRVIDPPTVPVIPIAPNRILLISIVLVAGLGAAGACGVLLGQLDQSINDVGQLRDFGVPVLGGISMVSAPRLRTYYPQAAALTAAVVVLIAIYGGLAGRILIQQRLMP